MLSRYEEVDAVIYTHAKHASIFALVHEPIPAVIEEFVLYVGGDVPIADYKLTGSAELGEEIASRPGKTSAVLMANWHGGHRRDGPQGTPRDTARRPQRGDHLR